MKYKEKLEEAKKLYASANADQKYVLESLFPELAELKDDETLRKNLIKAFNTVGGRHWGGLEVREILTWLNKQDEIDLEHYKDGENEKRKFVGYGFLKCKGDFLSFKEGETYWLEYIGDDKYNVRSDNLLGKTYHITPCQLYTVFKKLTWLEKQGEQKSTIKMKTTEESLGIDSDTYNKIVDECIYGEQKPVSITDEWIEDYWQHHKVINPYSYDKGEEIQFDHQGFVRFCKKYCRKPAWSEEDERIRKGIIRNLKYLADKAQGFVKDELEERIAWLESLKDRVGCEANCTTTKEWSEEDKEYLRRAINATKDVYPMTADWLKSLKDRVQTLAKIEKGIK